MKSTSWPWSSRNLNAAGLITKPVDPLDEAPPIRAAPKLAVGDHPKARRFLQRNHVADAAIEYLCKIFPVDALRLVILVGLPQFGRAQQAADVIGAERRPAIGAREH